MSSSFLSQQEIEALMRRLNPDVVDTLREEREAAKKDQAAAAAAAHVGEAPGKPAQEMERVEFPELKNNLPGERQRDVGFFQAIPVKLTLELGSATLTVREILNLQKNSVIKLNKLAGENAVLCVNGRPLSGGEVVVINDNFGCRVADPALKTAVPAEGEQR